MTEIGLIHHAGPVGRHQMPAIGHKGFCPPGKPFAYHVKHGGHHQRVLAQIAVSVNDIHRDAFFPERTIVFVDGFFVLHSHIARTFGIVQRPAVLLVEDDRHPGLGTAADHPRQACQHLAQARHFTPDAGIQMTHVVDNRAVEFLHRPAAFTPLEVLHRIRPVRHRLH